MGFLKKGKHMPTYDDYDRLVNSKWPDHIPIPEPEEEQVAEKEIKDEVETAFKFAFIGAGQGGSRIAETFYDFGYTLGLWGAKKSTKQNG